MANHGKQSTDLLSLGLTTVTEQDFVKPKKPLENDFLNKCKILTSQTSKKKKNHIIELVEC